MLAGRYDFKIDGEATLGKTFAVYNDVAGTMPSRFDRLSERSNAGPGYSTSFGSFGCDLGFGFAGYGTDNSDSREWSDRTRSAHPARQFDITAGRPTRLRPVHFQRSGACLLDSFYGIFLVRPIETVAP